MPEHNMDSHSDTDLRRRAEALVQQKGPRLPENLETLEPADLKGK